MNESNQQVAKVQGHTPGPWIVKHCQIWGATDERSKHESGRPLVAGIAPASSSRSPYVDNGHHDEECHANARLIAAAPDMLEVCEELLKAYNIDICDAIAYKPAVEMARAAIAKARGQ